jgi:hypothetical protein
MKDKIIDIIRKFHLTNEIKTYNEAAEQILRLLDVMESDCDHEWINDSFDHFGFLTGQVCEKCGAKQSVP